MMSPRCLLHNLEFFLEGHPTSLRCLFLLLAARSIIMGHTKYLAFLSKSFIQTSFIFLSILVYINIGSLNSEIKGRGSLTYKKKYNKWKMQKHVLLGNSSLKYL